MPRRLRSSSQLRRTSTPSTTLTLSTRSSDLDSLTFPNDPLATTLVESAAHAEEVEVIEPVEADLNALYNLVPLNEVLRSRFLDVPQRPTGNDARGERSACRGG